MQRILGSKLNKGLRAKYLKACGVIVHILLLADLLDIVKRLDKHDFSN